MGVYVLHAVACFACPPSLVMCTSCVLRFRLGFFVLIGLTVGVEELGSAAVWSLTHYSMTSESSVDTANTPMTTKLIALL